MRFRHPWLSGDIKVDPVRRAALLLLADATFRDEEETTLHELVHLVLWPLDTTAMDLVEVLGPEDRPARDFARWNLFRSSSPWPSSGRAGASPAPCGRH